MQKNDLVNKKSQSRAALRMLYELLFITEAKSRRVGTEEIQKKLLNLGFDVSLRTVQRDLWLMQELGLPVYSDDCSPKGWRIDTNNPLSEVVELLEAA